MRCSVMPITSLPANSFAIAGNHVDYFPVDQEFKVLRSTGNDGTYTVFLAAYSDALGTVISVNEAVPDATVDGYILLEGAGKIFTAMEQATLSVSTLVRITRTDGTVTGYTDHDVDIVWNGTTFRALGGYVPSAISTSAGLNVDNLAIEGPFTVYLEKADLIAGLYDYCTIDVYLIDHSDVTTGVIVLQSGKIGEVTLKDYSFSAQFRSKVDLLQMQIGEVTSPTCKAALGDSRCGITLSEWTETGTVLTVASDKGFTAAMDKPGGHYVAKNNSHAEDVDVEGADWFAYGRLTWTDGNNNGLKMEVATDVVLAGEFGFTLFLDMPYDIGIGDTFSVYPGCPRILSTCISKFDNVVNFRGEPHVPGETKAGDYGYVT